MTFAEGELVVVVSEAVVSEAVVSGVVIHEHDQAVPHVALLSGDPEAGMIYVVLPIR